MDPLNPKTPPTGIPVQPPMPESPKSTIGPLAGAVIVILLLIAGGLYFWGAELNKDTNNPPPFIPSDDTSMMQEDASVTVTSDTSAGLPPQSASDDVSSIEADAAAMNIGELDSANSAELNNI